VILLCFFCLCASAQGLNTQASKDDWEEINFEFNSAVLSDGFPSLLRLADLLNKHPGLHVRVEGHTDNLGGSGYNDKLGLERANTVRDFLVKYGAKAEQVEVTSRGATTPEVHGFKQHYSKTDVARWMNRRVVLTVTDEQGRTVSAGGAPEAIKAMTTDQSPNTCCADILKRLDKLDEIAQMLKDLAAQNANLKQQVADMQQKQSDLENQVKGTPKPLTENQTASAVSKSIEENREKHFSLLGVNVGGDTYNKDFTFNIKGRYFAPFKDHYAFEAQGEYDYYSAWREGEFDFGLVNRLNAFQMGAFASFKHVNLTNAQSGGTLGQAAVTADYIFDRGKVGLFATKSFLDNPLINSSNLVFSTTDSFGNTVNRTAPNVYVEQYLHVVDQIGVSGTFALWGNNYFEGNIGYLRRLESGPHVGGSGRLVFPIGHSLAFTVEGDANPTMMGASSWGQILGGIQFGDVRRPKDYGQTDKPIAVDIPQIRWEQATRIVHRGASPPIADAGAPQIGVPAGTITLNGSRSYDPNGEALTYQWTVEAGSASLASPTAATTTFSAQAAASYSFTLTVTNTDGLSASAHTLVTTQLAPTVPEVLFCTAQPLTVPLGQSTNIIWGTTGATTVTITPGVGVVPNSGSISVTPTQNTTYVVTATNSAGSNTCSVGVTVTQPGQNQGPQIIQFSANPGTINLGQSSTLTWQVNNATNISIAPVIGNVAANGNSGVSPAQTTTYTLTASNPYGTVSADVTVVVNASQNQGPQIVQFSANPGTIDAGQSSTLTWQVNNATNISIAPVIGNVAANGNAGVSPAQTTTYTLTASNPYGTVSANATVVVNAAPPPPPPAQLPVITSFTANPPSSPSPGSPVVLTCLATGARPGGVLISGYYPVDQNGNLTVFPKETTTYICVAVNSVGSVTKTLTVPVGAAPPPGGGPVFNLPGGNVVQTLNLNYTIDLTGTTSPDGSYPITYTTRVLGQMYDYVVNPTSATPTVVMIPYERSVEVLITATDSKGRSTSYTLTIYYIGPSYQ
jgi:hypothetical protein